MGKDGVITKVTKRPRDIPSKDMPIAFPPFENLHLELMENKRKLIPNLPLIPPKNIKPPPSPKKESHNPIQSEVKSSSKEGKKKKHKKKKHSSSAEEEDLDEIILPIAASSEEEKEADESEDDGMDDVKESSSSEEEKGEEEEEEDDPYAGLSPEERIAKEREEYIWRFRILKRKYKNSDIPAFNEHSDLNVMKTTYDRTLKELYLDDAIEDYRTYLKGGFILIEHLCTSWMNIDMEGFAVQQFKLMHRYDRLIIELGEKSYSTWGTNLPVELRLMGLVLFNAAVFYLGKIIAEKYGDSAAEFFMSFSGQPPQPKASPATNTAQPKMRGPRFKAEDLEN